MTVTEEMELGLLPLVCCMGRFLPSSQLLVLEKYIEVDVWYQKSTFDRTHGLAFRSIIFTRAYCDHQSRL